MTINARHRKHYKAGSVWKPGEEQEREKRTESWFQSIKHLLRPFAPTQSDTRPEERRTEMLGNH